ncbi:MAG: PDZ domain-containing protein [Gammaproteobacteria bacterium]|nr:PDZ domain-containing protein [Gammaproteobacteria bacterium]
MKQALVLCMVSLLSLMPVYPLTAAQHASPMPGALPGHSWLGVAVVPLSDELRAQLSALIPSEEGLLVDWVETDSPAARAGIRQFDVLVSFAGQKLYTPDQLSNLVRYSNPNSKIEIQLIQQGQPRTVITSLGLRQPRVLGRTQRPPYSRPPAPRQPPPLTRRPGVWDSFESIKVQTLADGGWRAEVSYRDRNNEINSFSFEGGKEEIAAQIRQHPQLPPDKKQAILQALDLRPEQMPGVGQYDFLDDLLRSPWLSRDPFAQPWFREPYYLDRYYYGPWRSAPWHLHLYPEMPDPGKP